MEIPLHEVSNVHRLTIPRTPHVKHDLYDNKLLDPAGVLFSGTVCIVKAYYQCNKSLEKGKPDLPPPLSLANNLWVGLILPLELSCLNFS